LIAEEFQKYFFISLYSYWVKFYYSLEKIKVIQDHHHHDHYLNFVLVQNKRNIFYQQPLLLNVQLMH
jgi:hypothetical protein